MAADDEGTATVTDEAADNAQNRDGTSVTNPPDPKDLPPEIKSLVENARKAERAARREAADGDDGPDLRLNFSFCPSDGLTPS